MKLEPVAKKINRNTKMSKKPIAKSWRLIKMPYSNVRFLKEFGSKYLGTCIWRQHSVWKW